MAKSVDQIRDEMPPPDQEPWGEALIQVTNDLLDLNQALEEAFAASPGNPMKLSARPTADILAYPSPFEGLSIPASDTGVEWIHHNGAWRPQARLSDVATRPRLITSWRQCDSDLYPPENGSLGASGTIDFADGKLRRSLFQERAWDPGYALRLVLLLAMDTTQAAAISLNLAYAVLNAGYTHARIVDLWRPGTVYTAGAQVIGLASDGWRYYTAAGGTSGASEPPWPTSGTVADNGWNWTAGTVQWLNLALSYTVSAQANQSFLVDSASLQVPAAALTATTQQVVGFFWRAASDAHGGKLRLLDGWFVPVEA